MAIAHGGEGFQKGMPKAEDVKGKVTGEVGGAMGVDSEGEVSAYIPEETKVGAVAQTWLSYKRSLQDPGISMLMGSGV